MSVKDLFSQIIIKDTYNIADGLYIIPNEFSGSFTINLKGFGEYDESLNTVLIQESLSPLYVMLS